MIYTQDAIRAMIVNSDQAVERAILAIYARQTDSEKAQGETTKLNGVGFNGAHARVGSYYARWLKSGKNLTGKHLEKGRKIALRYTRQLADIANQKEEARIAAMALALQNPNPVS